MTAARMPISQGAIIPALVTPFTSDDKLAPDLIGPIVDRALCAGAAGFYIGGSTGEAFLLSLDERRVLIETAVVAVDKRGFTIAHVGSISTDQAMELAEHAQAAGADAVSAVPPFYYKFGDRELARHYRDIMSACDLPMVVYNYPAASGVTLDSPAARELLTEKGVAAVKHTSMDLYALDRLRALRQDLVLLSGHDEVYLGALAMGADGAIGSTFNILTPQFIKIRDLFTSGNQAAARHLQHAVNNFIGVLLTVGVIEGIKHILAQTGTPAGGCRRPFKALDQNEKDSLAQAWDTFQRDIA